MLKFYWNGIKSNDMKCLQRVFYSDGKLSNHPEGTITIYSKSYRDFCREVQGAFKIQNDTEIQTDYIVEPHIRVEPTHHLYQQVKTALEAQKDHKINSAIKAILRSRGLSTPL